MSSLEIVMAPEDQDYGGRLYSCRDPEGNLWNFGSSTPGTATSHNEWCAAACFSDLPAPSRRGFVQNHSAA